MPTARQRGVRPRVAPLVVCAAAVMLAGCSGSSSAPSSLPTSPSTSTPTPHVTTTAAVDPAAKAVVALAVRSTEAQRSYSFVADERIAAGTTVRTHLTGRLVRGHGLAYTLTVGSRRTEVVRLPHATYLRSVPGTWSRLRKPRHLVNPTGTLLTVLHRMTPTQLIRRGPTRVVTGSLGAGDARAAGLPSLTSPAHVVVAVNSGGDVVSVHVRARTTVSGQSVSITLRTSYAKFGAVAPIRKPV